MYVSVPAHEFIRPWILRSIRHSSTLPDANYITAGRVLFFQGLDILSSDL